MTQQSIILAYLREIDGWVLAGKIRSIQTRFGFIGFRGDRDVRQLVSDGLLERKMEGKFAWVRAKAIDEIAPKEKIKNPPEEKEKIYPKKLKSHPIQMEIVNKINSLSVFSAGKKEKEKIEANKLF